MRKLSYRCTALLLLTSVCQSALARPVATSRMHCGGTLFTIRTGDDQGLMRAKSQHLEAVVDGKTVPIDLREHIGMAREAHDLGPPGRGRYVGTTAPARLAAQVTGRACLAGSGSHVLLLWYSCNPLIDDRSTDRYCSETGEWDRYVGVNGQLLDRGFALDDRRYENLERKFRVRTDGVRPISVR